MSRKLGEALIEQRFLDPGQLKRALDVQLIYGGHLGTCLVELGFIDVDTLGQVLSEQFSIGNAAREKLEAIDPATIALIPAKLADRHQVVPFELAGRVLHVAIVDPRNLLALDEIAFVSGRRIEAWIAPEILLHRALERYYSVPRKLRHITVLGQLRNEAPAPRRPSVEARATAVPATPSMSHVPASAPVLDAAPLAPPAQSVAAQSQPKPRKLPAPAPGLAQAPPRPSPPPRTVPETLQALDSTIAASPGGFVEQSRPRVHLQNESEAANEKRRSVDWIKYEREGRQSWSELFSLPLEHPHFRHLGGVYVIWHAGHHPVVRVGQGYLKTELTTLRLDPRLDSRNRESKLFVTWAAVSREDRDGIERFLDEMLDPEIPGQPPEAEPIPVNLPC